ncbi:MAG: RHS repeat-associated core domain-containing protein [Alphaproteobacteria bacterium]|nr:RHS repeat-associated core domain-containing protein [Alphaproteobacteria bacterium]
MRRADVTTQAGDDLFRHGGVGGGGVGGEAAIEIAGRLGARREEIFTYDTLNRLESATVSDTLNLTQLGQTTATYDALGNLTFKSDVGGYVYGAAGAGPHAVTQAGDTTYGYDAKGSMISATVTLTGAVLRGVTWGSFGKPVRIEEADGALASAFVYGPDRARIKQTSYVGATATKTVIYAGGGFERHITPGAPDELVHYIGGAVAMFTKTDDANPATDKTRYLHKDHLGSVVMVTDEAGLVAETRSYDAWGGLRNADWTVPAVTPFLTETARGFTGHEHLQAIGLIHMNGRVYDPKIGRMLSADPSDALNPGVGFNRYAYALNNPLSNTDPTGFCVWDACVAEATLGLIGIAMIHEAWNSEEGLELQASLRRAVRLQTTFVIVVWTEPVLQPDPEEEKSRPVGPSPVGDPGPDDDDDDKPFAMGLDTHLREFAAQHNATSFHDFTPEQKRNWKPEVLERLDDPKQELLVNLQDVKVWEGQTNLARNLGGSTDWELNEIRKREHIWGRIEWWDGHKKVDNPFDPPVSDPSESPGADPNEPPEEDTNG